jgi:DNA-binding transcriptional MocR family regulator
MLWIEIAEQFDSLELNRRLLEQGIQIAPGSIFSAAGKYRNCLRLNYAARPSPELEAAVRCIGETAMEVLSEAEPSLRHSVE